MRLLWFAPALLASNAAWAFVPTASFIGSSTVVRRPSPFAVVSTLGNDVLADDTSSALAASESDAVPPVSAETADAPAAAETAEAVPPRRIQRERFTLFLGNLSFEATESDIRSLLSPSGKVVSVNIPKNRDTGVPRGFAFVDMGSPEELEAAVAAVNGVTYQGRELRANKSLSKEELEEQKAKGMDNKEKSEPKKKRDEAEGRKIYVGNLPFEVSRDALNELFSKYGEVEEVFIPQNPGTGMSRGFAFITMKSADSVAPAIESTNEIEFMGRTLEAKVPLPPGEKSTTGRKRAPVNDRKTKLYVGNLSYYTVAETLQELFEEFGEVTDCYLPEDPTTGTSRGFGFVTMDKAAAEAAIAQIDGCELDGRIIRVNEAMPKFDKRSSSSRNKRDMDSGYEEDNE